MKIRSNSKKIWSLAGLRMEPGVVVNFDILKCRDIRQLKAVLQEIEKGNISIVEQDDLFKSKDVVKVEKVKPIKPELQEDLVVVTKQGTFKDEIPADILEEPKVTETQVTKIDVEVQPEVVVKESGIKNEFEETGGFVVIPGKKPGEGQLKTVSNVIQEKTDEIAEVLKDATKELESLNKKEEVIKDIPEDIDKILKMKVNERKLYIAKIEDKELLLNITKYTKVKSILNIVSQRLEELK